MAVSLDVNVSEPAEAACMISIMFSGTSCSSKFSACGEAESHLAKANMELGCGHEETNFPNVIRTAFTGWAELRKVRPVD